MTANVGARPHVHDPFTMQATHSVTAMLELSTQLCSTSDTSQHNRQPSPIRKMLAHTRFTLLAALATVSSVTAVSAFAKRDMSEVTATVQPVLSSGAVSMAALDKRDDRPTLKTVHPVPRSAAPDDESVLRDMMRKGYVGVGTQSESGLKPRAAQSDKATGQDEGAVGTESAARMKARALAGPDVARPTHTKREKHRRK